MRHVLKIAEIVTANFQTLELKSRIEQAVPPDRTDRPGVETAELVTTSAGERAARLSELRRLVPTHPGSRAA